MFAFGWLMLFLAVGMATGWFASIVMGERGLARGWSVVLGLAGSMAGGMSLGLLGMSRSGWLSQAVVGIAGACLVLFVAERVLNHTPT